MRVSDEELAKLPTDDEMNLTDRLVLDLRDARARVAELEEQLRLTHLDWQITQGELCGTQEQLSRQAPVIEAAVACFLHPIFAPEDMLVRLYDACEAYLPTTAALDGKEE